MYPFKKDGSWIKPKYVLADALVRYWCCDEETCLELLKSELFQACKSGHVEYRTKGQNLSEPVEFLFAERKLYIQLESFDNWVADGVGETKEVKDQNEELEYHQTVKIDEEAFSKSSKEFQKLIDQATLSDEEKVKFGLLSVKADSAEQVPVVKGSYTPETYEFVIATLDECLMGRFKEKFFRTNKELRKFISDVYGELNGISESNLNHVIADARKRLKEAYDPKENEKEILSKYNLE